MINRFERTFNASLIFMAFLTICITAYYSFNSIHDKSDEDLDVLGQNAATNSELVNKYCMYGVYDENGGDSQIFHMDMDEGIATSIGPIYKKHDIESFDINPLNGEIIAIAGGGGDQGIRDGEIFRLDKASGALVQIGDTGIRGDNEIVSGSFHPNGEYWAGQENIGLVKVSLTEENFGSVEVIFPMTDKGVARNWEGLAWNPSGTKLYASQYRNLFEWDPTTGVATRICGSNFLPGDTEALEFRNDGKLYGGVHHPEDNSLNIFEIGIDQCTITSSNYAIPYNDVETITFELCNEEIEIEFEVLPEEVEQPVEEETEPPIEAEPPVELEQQYETLPFQEEEEVAAEIPEVIAENEVVPILDDSQGEVLGGSTTQLANVGSREEYFWHLILVGSSVVIIIGMLLRSEKLSNYVSPKK